MNLNSPRGIFEIAGAFKRELKVHDSGYVPLSNVSSLFISTSAGMHISNFTNANSNKDSLN